MKKSIENKVIDFAMKYKPLHDAPIVTKEQNIKEKELLKKQAEKREGLFHKSLAIGRSYFTFDYRGKSIKSHNRHEYVEVGLKIKSNVKLFIYFKDLSNNHFLKDQRIPSTSKYTQSFTGLKPIEIDDKKFNKKFVIKGNDASLSKFLIDYNIRKELIRLEKELFNPVLFINKKDFLFFAYNRIYEEEDYDKIIEFVIKMVLKINEMGF